MCFVALMHFGRQSSMSIDVVKCERLMSMRFDNLNRFFKMTSRQTAAMVHCLLSARNYYWASIVNPFGRYRWRSEDIFANEKIARQMIEQFDDLSISRSEYQRLAAAQIARDAVLSVASTRK